MDKKNSTNDQKAALIDDAHDMDGLSINAEDINNMIDDIQSLMKGFVLITEGLSRPSDRFRKLGSGIRRYGFIDKTSDLAETNPQFSPAYFTSAELKSLVRDIELCRNLSNVLNQFSRVVQDSLLLYGDQAFSLALLYYQSVRELSRRNIPGAQEVFRALEPFFRTKRRPADEPTEEEVERDVKALLHGTKEGEVVVKNEKPHLEGGKRTVVDEVN